MCLLADENMDEAIVRWLRGQGFDVKWIAQSHPGTADPQVLQLANDENRIVLTNDLDFGEHVIRHHQKVPGVVQLRLSVETQEERLALLQHHWPEIQPQAMGHLMTVTDQRVRVRSL